MTTPDTKMSIIRVFSYEPGTKVNKQKRTLEFLVSKNDDRKLEVIREQLVKHKVLGALDVRNPFCDAAGAEVSDQMTIAVYLDQLVEEIKEAAEPDTQSKAPAKSKENETPKFYYKKKKVQTKTDDATQEFLKKKLDLKLRSNPTFSPMRAQLLQSAFQSDKWTAAPAAKLSVVAELNERDWSVIARTNCLLSGQRLMFGEDLKNPIVERTPFNAFKIKSRKFDSYEIVAPMVTPVSKNGATENKEFGELKAHIPRFRVDDSSYVTVIETQNSLESSMVKSSFNQSSIEASAGGGFWGASAAAKAGVSTKKGQNEVTANAEKQRQMHVIYSFPRVTVYLDADSLELTEEVKRDIAEVKKLDTKDSVKAFGDKYGHVFSRRVKLGGRLLSSHQSTERAAENQASSENSLKAAAAVSISGWGFSASAEASHETSEKKDASEKKQDFASNMAWEATGGNTVLCNDPPQWCGTVGNFRNWRIVEQNDIIPITKLISTFDGFENTETEFHEIAETDTLSEDKTVCTRIQLTDTRTGDKLVALPKDQTDPLTSAFEGIKTALKAQASLKNVADEAGAVKFDDGTDKQLNASNWILEQKLDKGMKPYLLSGVKCYIRNEAMPEAYLALTEKLPFTKDSGFLYIGAEKKNRGSFVLERPGMTDQSPVRRNDTVVLNVWDDEHENKPRYVMRGGTTLNSSTVSKDFNQVPSFGPEEVKSRRVLKFKVDIIDY